MPEADAAVETSEAEDAARFAESPVAAESDQISINTATYEDFRTLGLSVTQTGRVLAHRERVSGFDSLDDLDQIPGFPRAFLDELKRRVRL